MAKLYVVRHAAVAVDFDLPASDWQLSGAGIEATRKLVDAGGWEDVRHIYYSPEVKARQTASIISQMTGTASTVVEDLRELRAPILINLDEFQGRVGAYLDGFADPEFEPWDEAGERIARCVEAILDEADGLVAIVSHGRILTAWFSHWLGRRLSRRDWESMGLPDLSVVDIDSRRVERGFFSDVAACPQNQGG